MSEKIVVPALGESVTEATVSKWLKSVGEQVDSDEPVVELETDKVNVEVPSPSSGVLENISVKEGATVEVGTLLGSVGASDLKDSSETNQKQYTPPVKEKKPISLYEETQISKKPTNKKPIKKENKKKSTNGVEPLILDEKTVQPPLLLEEEQIIEEPIVSKKAHTASPSAKKIAKERNINLEEIKGTGKRGMVMKGDLLDLMGSKPQPNLRKVNEGPEERIKMTRLRLTIAKRLKEAQNNAAMLTTFNEVDMFNIKEIRKNYQEEFQKKYSVKLGFMSFFIKACIVSLKNYPAINAEIQGEEIVYKNYYNISFAKTNKDWQIDRIAKVN